MVLLAQQLLHGCFETANGVFYFSPASEQLLSHSCLNFRPHSYPHSAFFFRQHALIQNHCALSVFLFLKVLPACELPLPKTALVGHNFCCVAKKRVVDRVGVALLQSCLELFYSLLKGPCRFQLDQLVPAIPKVIDGLMMF